MGFNTVILVLNDVQDAIDVNPAGWWREVRHRQVDAMARPQRFGFGYSANGFEVVSCHHADTTRIIAFGGNAAHILGTIHTGHGALDEERLLRSLAAQHGYTLSKRRKAGPKTHWPIDHEEGKE